MPFQHRAAEGQTAQCIEYIMDHSFVCLVFYSKIGAMEQPDSDQSNSLQMYFSNSGISPGVVHTVVSSDVQWYTWNPYNLPPSSKTSNAMTASNRRFSSARRAPVCIFICFKKPSCPSQASYQ